MSRKYPYIFFHEKYLIGFLVLIAFAAYSKFSHMETPIQVGEGKIVDFGIMIFTFVMMAFGVFTYFQKKKKLNKEIILTNDSIIAHGHKDGMKGIVTVEVKFADVKEFKLQMNRQKQVHLVIKSSNSRIELYKGQVSDDDFINIYDHLALILNEKLFENCDENIKFHFLPLSKQFEKDKDLFFLLGYLFFQIFLIFSFEKNASMQIEADLIIIVALILNLVLISLISLKLFKSKILFSNKFKKPGSIFVLILFFVFGSVGLSSVFAYLNQTLDSSVETTKESFLVKDSQDEKSIKRDGICYQVVSFDDAESRFGDDKLCEKMDPNLKEGKRVIVYYKQGLFKEKWATKIVLK